MSHGFVLPLPCDVAVEAGRFSLGLAAAAAGARGASARAAELSCAGADCTARRWRGDAIGAIKFNSFWTIELEPGWSLMVDAPGQPRRPAVPACRPAWWTRIGSTTSASTFPPSGPTRISAACCRAACRWRSATRCRANRRHARVRSHGARSTCTAMRRGRGQDHGRAGRVPKALSQQARRGVAASSSPAAAKRASCAAFAQLVEVEPEAAHRGVGERVRDAAEAVFAQPVRAAVGAHRASSACRCPAARCRG